MFLGLGIPELAIILIVVLIIFGPKNLPKLGASLGKTVKSVREGMEEGEEAATADKPKAEIAESADVEPAPAPEVAAEPEPAPVPVPAAEPAPARDSVFCTKCGTENDADAAFCKNCGNKLSA